MSGTVEANSAFAETWYLAWLVSNLVEAVDMLVTGGRHHGMTREECALHGLKQVALVPENLKCRRKGEHFNIVEKLSLQGGILLCDLPLQKSTIEALSKNGLNVVSDVRAIPRKSRPAIDGVVHNDLVLLDTLIPHTP